MSRKFLIPLVAAAVVAAPILAKAESAARTTTVKSSKSNTSDRMGGGPGKGAVARKMCVSWKTYHMHDDRYCQIWVNTK